MNNLKYQKDYWKTFASTSEENNLARDLNSSWDENSKSYLNATEIPQAYISYLKDKINFNKVIDFGVGFGRNQKYLASLFKEVHGFDLPEMIERYKKINSIQSTLLTNITETHNDYDLVYETTAFQHMPPEEVLYYLISLSFKSKYFFSWTRSYNDYLRDFQRNIGGINIYHLIMSTNSWEPISFSNNNINNLNDETHYYALYKSINIK